ncbi:MAG: hypothetical protein R3B93_05635 [Bacteroidia bacterium]
MEKLALRIMLLLMGTMIVGETFAQPESRVEDHFFRRRVVNRIDLSEKINRPLIQRTANYYANSNSYKTQGLVSALMHGFREGRYIGYKHDNLNEYLDFATVEAKMKDLEFNDVGDIGGEGEEIWEEEEVPDDPEFDIDLDTPDSNLSFLDENPVNDPLADLGAYETVVQFVEDRIFDKKLSKWVYKIDQIQIIWTDPGETLPDKYLVSFKYDDVKDLLDEVKWVNRFNDAETRTIKEVLDLRLFHSYIIDISGNGVASLAEAEYRRQKLVEFEHHLWNY